MKRRSVLTGAVAAAAIARTSPVFAQNDSMKALVDAAKAEGTVVVDGPPIDACRQALVEGFQGAYGIPVSYISSGSSASGARVRAERAAGKYLLDAFVSGGDTPTMTFMPSGWLDRIEPALVAPDVVDRRKWKDNRLPFFDENHTIMRTQAYVTPELVINTKLVKPGEVTGWRSLLDPRWEGKILAKDPGVSGAGTSLIAMLYMTFGPDFVKRLYKDQKPTISRDARQAAQFIANGNYAILMGPEPVQIEQFQHQGYPISFVFPKDAPGIVSGGWSLLCLMNKAPHPNAAKLFLNWLAGRQGQTAFANSLAAVSLRNDVTYTDTPAWAFPDRKTRYLDTYDFKFATESRDAALAKARALLGE